jgi:hypothetical protein
VTVITGDCFKDGYCNGNVSLSAFNIITVSLYNIVNGSSLGNTAFSNVTGNITFNYFNITSAGFCVSYTGNGTGTNCTASGSGASTYFNVTNTTSITGTQSVTASTYQTLFEIQASRLFLNTSIASFNGTNGQVTNQTSTGILYLKALNGSNNVKIDVAGNFSKNITCNGNSLTTVSCNATGIHDNFYYFNATDIWNDVAIANFTLTLTNASLGGDIITQSTTNGSMNLSLLRGYNYLVQFTTPNGTYEYLNVSLPANASTHRYEFQVLPAPSIDITIRDAATSALITQNMTVVLTSNSTGDIFYTVTGGYFATDLNPEQYSIRIYGTNYSASTYTVTANQGSVYYLTAYLQQNASEVIMQFVDSISSSVVLAGTSVTQYRLVNGSWAAISSRVADVTGRVVFGYLDDLQYRFIATKTGYATKQFDLDPILFDTYTIKMQRSTSLDFSEDFQSIYLTYSPTLFYDGQQNNITILYSSPEGTLTIYSYRITYPGGSNTGSGSNVVGESFLVPINITGANITDRVNISLTYDTSLGSPKTFNYSNAIIVSPGSTTHIANQDNTYGLGLLERLFIATIIVIIAAGLITLGLGPLPGMIVGLLVFGYFVKIGFIEWWAIGLSLLAGVAFLAARSD